MFKLAEPPSALCGLYRVLLTNSLPFRLALLSLTVIVAIHLPVHLRPTPYLVIGATLEQSADDSAELVPGSSTARELPGGETHAFRVRMAASQYLRVLVVKNDLSMLATILDPDGRRVGEFVSRRYSPLRLSFIAATPGVYRLEIQSLEKEPNRRPYELRIEEARQATRRDRQETLAVRSFAGAEKLRAEWTEESFKEAVNKYVEAEKSWRSISERRGTSEALEARGEVYFTLGQYAPALDCFKAALAESRAAGDRPGEIRALNNIGYVYVSRGDNQRTSLYCRKALRYYRPSTRALAPDAEASRGEAQAVNNTGEIHYSLGELKKALDDFQRALDLWSKAGDRRGQALAHINLGYTYSDSGDLPKAFAHFQQALALWQALDDRRGEALSRTALGAVNSFLGEWQTALDAYKQALQIFRSIGDRQSEAVVRNSLGQIYEDLNELQTALDYYQLALKLNQENGNRDFEAVTQYYIGRAYRLMGDAEQALAHYRQSLILSRKLGKRRIAAYAFTDIGAIYNSLGQRQFALRQYREVLKFYREAGDRRGQANTLKTIGDTFYSSGEKQQALACYRQALSLSRAAGDRSGEAAALYDIAHAAREDDLDGALRDITGSIEIIESLRAQVVNQQLRASYFASAHKHYGLYVDLLMRAHRLNPAGGYAAAALQASESARARSLVETLGEVKPEARLGVAPALLERERALRQMLSAKAVYQMRLRNSAQTETEAEQVEKEIRQLTNEYQDAQARIRAQSPRYTNLTQPPPMRLEDIQAELKNDDTILLEYALGDEVSYLWVVSAHSLTSYELPERSQIEKEAREVYQLLTARQSAAEETPAGLQRRLLFDTDKQYWQRATELSRTLLGQVAGQLGVKRLLIVADGALQYIPFEALPVPAPPPDAARQTPASEAEDASEITPLTLRHEIAYLPSASTLVILRREKALSVRAPKTVFVMADPVFDRKDERVSQSAAEGQPEGAARAGELGRALRDAAELGGRSDVPRLPSTRQEADAILAFTADGEGAKATGFKASRETALSDELSQYRIVHFATHSIVNSIHPELSGIVLSMVNERGEDENGFLQLQDIYGLKLSADLVVLSACDTGLGKDVRGEGLVGLTRGFMYAGAGGVVASLWKVDDQASAELMNHFYKAMLEDGLTSGAALQAAKEAMWKQKRWRHPYYWASFVLQGEYDNKIGGSRFFHVGSRRAVVAAVVILLLGIALALLRVMRRAPVHR